MSDLKTCQCCGYKTLDTDTGFYDICPICFWEDDPVQNDNPFDNGGANKVSLIDAQSNFKKFGASEISFLNNVRKPNKNDILDENWSSFK